MKRAALVALVLAACGGSGAQAPVMGPSGPGGRVPRRLSADQLRASLVAATGEAWTAERLVLDPDQIGGYNRQPNADLLDALAPTLGRPDYAHTTSEMIDPAITFTKLASDAARAACRASVKADVAQAQADKRRILRWVSATDTLASNAAAVRKNVGYLGLRFWGRTMAADDADLATLTTLFDRASSQATPPDGWRAVCIALATDPQFLTY
jgi:hypothetical protein